MKAAGRLLLLVLCAPWMLQADRSAREAYERANAFFVQQKFTEALAAADEALRLDPKMVPALTLKAKVAMAGGHYETASDSLKQALAIDPNAPYAQFLYGLVAYMGNDLQAAFPRFQKARELNPKDPRVALYLGLTVESLGQPAKAMSLYEEAVRLDGPQAHAEMLLPGAKLLLLLGRPDESEKWVRAAVKASPNSRDVHFELARVLLNKGNAAEAASEGEKALTLSDGVTADAAIHYLLIRAWQQNGNPERAEQHAAIMRAQETPARPPAKR